MKPNLRAVDGGAEPSWTDTLATSSRGGLLKCVDNVITILTHDERWAGVLGWNALTGQPEALRVPPWFPDDCAEPKAGEMGDEDMVRLEAWFARAWNYRPGAKHIERALMVAVRRSAVHPVEAYLRGLEWDGKKRVDRWLTYYLGVPFSDYSQSVGRWWMIAAVARALDPGCMAKTLLILEGPQDLKKSTAARILGGEWFRDSHLAIGNKDAYIGLKGCWIREIPEIDGLNKHDAALIKALIASPSDSYRPPFGKLERQHPRSCIFIGTVNPDGAGYLKDSTGGSRFHPVKCTAIDAEALKNDRDQLWAEAVQLYLAGERWWAETEEEKDMCRGEQEQRFQNDALELALGEWLEDVVRTLGHSEHRRLMGGWMTQDVILRNCLGIRDPSRWDRALQTRIGQAMARMGWISKRRRLAGEGKRRVLCYLNPILIASHGELAAQGEEE